MAKLHFKYGAMNSGKSDTLIKTAYNYTERGLKVLVVKPSIDTKGEDTVVARGGHSRKVDILATPTANVANEVLKTKDVSCVLVDESQFLTPEQIGQLFKLAKQHGISVICYGLRADFRTKLFPGSTRLFEIADNIEKLPTMCFCGSQADGDDIVYDSLCGVCYIREGGVI